MKNIIFIIISLFTLLSCKKDFKSDQIQTEKPNVEVLAEAATSGHIGDPNRTPDLYIPELEYDWQYRYIGLGLRSYGVYPVFIHTDGDTSIRYSCWIANGAPIDYSGRNDFVVCMPCDGFLEGSSTGVYSFPGMLSIITFQNGFPIGEVIKQRFFVANTDVKNGVVWSNLKQYGRDTMFISAGASDEYLNRAKATMGKQVIVVEINPDTLITETNINNNVSTLPVNVSSLAYAGAVLDLSALDENKPHPATNLSVTPFIKGKRILRWDCPYHQPIYVKHWFTMYKDGIVVADKLKTSEYILKGNYKGTYGITITIPGLGTSQLSSITINK